MSGGAGYFLQRYRHYAPRIMSFAALATRNLTTVFALIWICSPVAGLRPMRAGRNFFMSLPSPGKVTSPVFLTSPYTRDTNESTKPATSFFVCPVFSASAWRNSVFLIDFPISVRYCYELKRRGGPLKNDIPEKGCG